MQKNRYCVHESIWRKREHKTDLTVNQQKQKKILGVFEFPWYCRLIIFSGKFFFFNCFFLNFSEKHNYTEVSFFVRLPKKKNSPLDRFCVCILDLWGGQHWSASGVINIQFAVVEVGNDLFSALILGLWNLSNDHKKSKGNDDKEDKKNIAA